MFNLKKQQFLDEGVFEGSNTITKVSCFSMDLCRPTGELLVYIDNTYYFVPMLMWGCETLLWVRYVDCTNTSEIACYTRLF